MTETLPRRGAVLFTRAQEARHALSEPIPDHVRIAVMALIAEAESLSRTLEGLEAQD